MSIKINDSFLKDLENFSDEEDIFDSERNTENKETILNHENKIVINIADSTDKLLNSTRLRKNKRFYDFLKELEIDSKKLDNTSSNKKNENFKNSNT